MNKQFENKYILTGKEDIDEIQEHIRRKISTYQTQNRATYRQWLLNAAFSRGDHWGNLSIDRDVFLKLKPPEGRNYVTDDMISPWKHHMVATMTVSTPSWDAVPKRFNHNDIMACRTANDLLMAFWEYWRFIEKDITLSSYLIDFSNALIFIRYNETAGEEETIYNTDTGEPLEDADGNIIRVFTKTGNISADIAPPHHLGCPLDPRDIDEKEWIFWQQSKPLGYFKNKYDKKGEQVVEEFEREMHTSLNSISRGRSNDKVDEPSANEIFFMQKPCDECPDGLVIPYTNGIILDEDRDTWEWQFLQMKEYPVIHVHGLKESGEFWARSSIERQIPLQRTLNMLRSCMADNADNMAHMKWLVHVDANVDDIWDTNELIKYEGNIPPLMADVKPLPQWISEERESLKLAIRDVQSYHGTSQGTSVSGVRSDAHAENLQEQDMMPWTIIDNLKAGGYARMGEKVLRIYAEKMPDYKMSFISDGRPIVIENFKAAMLNSIARVNVKMTNGRMRSKAMVKNEVLQWFGAGMIADPFTGQRDPHEAMKLLEFAVPESYFDTYRIPSNQQFLENENMYRGEVPVPYPWQNHIIHLKILREEMNSPRFMTLITMVVDGDMEAKKITDLFVKHLQKTSQLLANAMPRPPQQEAQQETSQKGETEQNQQT